MTTIAISPEHRSLLESIEEAEKAFSSLNRDLDALNSRLDGKSGERHKYELLNEVCDSLDQLAEIGVADLFWGEDYDATKSNEHLARVRNVFTAFLEEIESIEKSKQTLERRIKEQLTQIYLLNEDLDFLLEQEERAQNDYMIEREARELPYRPMLMPWEEPTDDKRRLRKSLAQVFLFVISLSFLISIWELPQPDENEVVEIPERLVKLVQKENPKPRPPEQRVEQKEKKEEPKDKKVKKKPVAEKPKATESERKVARKKAEQSGILAFKENFSELLADDVDAKLGSAARLNDKGRTASGDTSRNLLLSQVRTSSGGINTAGLSRDVDGSGTKLSGVSFSRIESAVGTDLVADDRPLSDGPGPSRTDEEIQIVFDRYKAALYRIYNRELRRDPTLKGKMVLRITIEPDGTVSFAAVESTDLDSPDLSTQIVARVERFNFGPKDGVAPLTILYPIDFLPAT